MTLTTPTQVTTNDVIDCLNVSDIVTSGMSDYMKLMLMNTFPDPIDGLKKVHIRILFSAYKDTEIFNKKVKTSRLVSKANEYHPYGDVPIFEVIIKLSQPWNTDPCLFMIDGNSGSYTDSTSAMPRYIDVEVTDFAKSIFFGKNINIQSIPMIRGESLLFEPKYFIPAVPTALLYAYCTIGVGYQSKPLPLQFDNVCDLVHAYSKHLISNNNQPFNYHKHILKLLPSFPTYCRITNEKELLEQYDRGVFDAKIHMDGEIEVLPDRIVIHSLPFGNSFDSLEDNIQNLVTESKKTDGYFDKMIEMIVSDKIDNESKANLILLLRKGTDPFQLFDRIKKLFKFSDTYVPNPNYILEGSLYRLDPIQLMSLWMKHRKELVRVSKVKQIKSLMEQLSVLKAVVIILNDYEVASNILRNTRSIEEVTRIFMEKYGLSYFQCNAIYETKLKSINPELMDKYKDEILVKEKIVATLYEELKCIVQEIGDEALQLKKKYGGHGSRTVYPNYLGYINFEYEKGGYIQFDTMEELFFLLSKFAKIPLSVYLYEDEKKCVFCDVVGRPTRQVLNTKNGIGKIVNTIADKHIYTVRVGASFLYSSGIQPLENSKDHRYLYSTDKIIGIHKNGKLEITQLTKISTIRKNIDKVGVQTTLVYAVPFTTKTVYMYIFNSANKNKIRITKLNSSMMSVKNHLVGKSYYGHCYGHDDQMIINCPQEFLNRNTTKVVIIQGISKLMKNAEFIDIDINSNAVKSNKYITLV